MADVRITTSIAGAENVKGGLRGIDQQLDGVKQSGSRLATTLRNAVVPALGALAASVGIRELVQAADTYKLLEGRLKLVTDGARDLAETQERLFEVAQRTRGSFESTVELYARLGRSTKQLGVSQGDLLTVTEAINQAVVVSGATAQEASAGLIQFAQGLASGALRGDELRSVLEQMPRLAEAIAEGMGITVGQLRELGTEGKLSAEAVVNAIKDQADVINQEFAQMPVTVGHSMQILKNEFLLLIGRVDETSGATSGLAGVIQDLADFISLTREAAVNFAGALTGSLGPEQELTQQTKAFATAVLVAAEAVDQLATSLRTVLLGAFKVVGDAIGGLAAAITQLFQREWTQAWNTAKSVAENASSAIAEGSRDLGEELNNSMVETMENVAKIWKDSARDIKDSNDEIVISTKEVAPQVRGVTEEVKKQKEATEELSDATEEVVETAKATVPEWVETWKRAGEQLQDALGDTFRNIFDRGLDSFSDLKDAVLDIFKDLAAEIAAAFTFDLVTEKLLPSIGLGGLGSVLRGTVGGGTTGGDTGGVGGSALGVAGAIAPNDAVAAAVGGLLGKAGAPANFVSSVVENISGAGFLDLGAGFLGGLGANELFGGGTGTSVGSTIGGAIGTAVGGPVGSFLGSFLGGGIGSLFGGDDKPSRPRFGAELNLRTGQFAPFTRTAVPDSFINAVGNAYADTVKTVNQILDAAGFPPLTGTINFATFQGRTGFAFPGEGVNPAGRAFRNLDFTNTIPGRVFGDLGGRTDTPSQQTLQQALSALADELTLIGFGMKRRTDFPPGPGPANPGFALGDNGGLQRVMSFQTGGDAVFTRPTMLQVGEVGPEDVSIRPLGGRRSRGGITINMNGPNIIDDISMEQFVRRIAERVERA